LEVRISTYEFGGGGHKYPAIPLLGIYTKELKAESQTGICTPMFVATLFTVAKR
jgi:hypothetical protein